MDPLAQLAAAVDAVLAADPTHAPTAALADDVVGLRRAINRLEAAFAARLGEFDRRHAAAAEALPTAAWLRHHCHLSAPAAAAAVAAARRLPDLPATAAALAAGDISAEHVRAITRGRDQAARAAVAAAEDVIANYARATGPAETARLARHVTDAAQPEATAAADETMRDRRWLSMSDTIDGMLALDGLLDPEAGATVKTALAALLAAGRQPGDTRTAAQARADAFTDLARGALDTGRLPETGGEKPHLTVTVDLTTLARQPAPALAASGQAGATRCGGPSERAGGHAIGASPSGLAAPDPDRGEEAWRRPSDGSDENRDDEAAARARHAAATWPRGTAALAWAGTISPETARRIACDARVTRVLTRGPSEIVDIGRATRTIPPAIRRALDLRDRGCTWPGCDRPPAWTDAHHITHWADGGATSLDNLVLLCRHHHRAVHHGHPATPAHLRPAHAKRRHVA